MATWLCVPSARPADKVSTWVAMWKAQGYRVALWRDDGYPIAGCDITMGGAYPGWPKASNALIAEVLDRDPECAWVACGGDDNWPDPNRKADQIAAELTAHFDGTFGACQPTGDEWADAMGVIIERIAGSPFLGRDLCRRLNGGTGPWWSEYHHSWADEELMLVTQKLGVFLRRPDLCHFHDHCLRYPGGKWAPHLQHVSADYVRMKPVFEARKKAGFPGHEPLAQIGAKA